MYVVIFHKIINSQRSRLRSERLYLMVMKKMPVRECRSSKWSGLDEVERAKHRGLAENKRNWFIIRKWNLNAYSQRNLSTYIYSYLLCFLIIYYFLKYIYIFSDIWRSLVRITPALNRVTQSRLISQFWAKFLKLFLSERVKPRLFLFHVMKKDELRNYTLVFFSIQWPCQERS